MKTIVMTIMALMVATVAVAEEKKIVEGTHNTVEFTIDRSGNDNNGFDVKVRNRGTSAWTCAVELDTDSSVPRDKRQFTYDVRVDSNVVWVNGYSGTVPNLQCRFKSVTCTGK